MIEDVCDGHARAHDSYDMVRSCEYSWHIVNMNQVMERNKTTYGSGLNWN